MISLSHCVRCKIEPALISDEKAVKKYYKKKSGKELNLDNPQTFSEKLNWYKLNDRNPLMAKCADKVSVRDYLKEKGYGDCLNEVYGVYDRVNDIDLSKLPNQFVIKAAHGSHMNYIVKDKERFDWKHAKKMMKTWLHQDIYWSGREWVYKSLPKRIIIEPYIEDETGELRGFKFFCFNGNCSLMQYEPGRYDGRHIRNFYDMEWKLLPFGKEMDFDAETAIEKPDCFDEMKKIAISLSESFNFVRVDFYQVNNKVYFGEMTFFPAGGAPNFKPEKYDALVGSYWIMRKDAK